MVWPCVTVPPCLVDEEEHATRKRIVTDVNVGRFSLTTGLYDLIGKHSTAEVYLGLALGNPVEIAAVVVWRVADHSWCLRDTVVMEDAGAAARFDNALSQWVAGRNGRAQLEQQGVRTTFKACTG